jgi:hydrogenase/urease accessory protein HupE
MRRTGFTCAGLRALFILGLVARAPVAWAHEARPAYLELTESAPGRYTVLWRTPLLSGMPLPVVLKLPIEVRNLTAPAVSELSDSLLERRMIAVPGGGLAGRRIDFVGLQCTITDVLVRVQTLAGGTSTVLVTPSKPWVEVEVSLPSSAVASAYVRHGIQHIAFGIDHLLFVLGLVLLPKTRRMLLKTVVAFLLASSLTLAVATLVYVDLPALPLNAAIALSTLFLGLEIMRAWRGDASFTIRHPWVVALLFGVLHGCGLARALTGIGLPRQDLPLALLSFNLGVEIAEAGLVLLVVLLGSAFRVFQPRWPSWAPALPAYAIGSLGAYWTIRSIAILFGATR